MALTCVLLHQGPRICPLFRVITVAHKWTTPSAPGPWRARFLHSLGEELKSLIQVLLRALSKLRAPVLLRFKARDPTAVK